MPTKPVAWMRKWAFDGEEPRKEKRENGRMVVPAKFNFAAVTIKRLFLDDVPLVAATPLDTSTQPE